MNQTQNEAMVKLLLVARYQDKKLSLSEEEAFNQQLEALTWHAPTDVGTFAMRETAEVRQALDTPDSTMRFLKKQCAVFVTADEKNACLTALTALVAADGEDARENQFLQNVRSLLQ